MTCSFCKNVVHEDRLCVRHLEMVKRIIDGKASESLNKIYTTQKTEECYVPPNNDVLFGYTKVPVIRIALFFARIPYRKSLRYTRSCQTKNCHNTKHIIVGGERTPTKITEDLRKHKSEIERIIKTTSFELCCIPGFVLEENGKQWTYFNNRKTLLGTALLNYHAGSQPGSAVRLCTTPNCYNHLHYKWGTVREQEQIRKKRLYVEKPEVPPEIEWELWNKYKKMKNEDIPLSIVLSSLSKVYKTTADNIQAIIVWSKFR